MDRQKVYRMVAEGTMGTADAAAALYEKKLHTVRVHKKDVKDMEEWLDSEGFGGAWETKKKDGDYFVYTFDDITAADYAGDFGKVS